MEIKDLISSGMLESFVLGETTEKETADILLLAEKHPEIREEIDRIEDTLHTAAMLGATPPPAHVRHDFLSNIEPSVESEFQNNHYGNNLSVSPRRFNTMAAAIAALLVVSAAFNVWLYNNWQQNKEQVSTLLAEKQVLAANDKKREASLEILGQKLALLENPDVALVVLKGTPKIPNALANVYWNKTSGETYLDLATLPNAPEGKQYQLWAIVDGKPVDAGVFDAAIAGKTVLKMKTSLKPTVFAVTIENAGGSESPTLDQMVLVGNNG
jgi:anti-sigma-K factor RskA